MQKTETAAWQRGHLRNPKQWVAPAVSVQHRMLGISVDRLVRGLPESWTQIGQIAPCTPGSLLGYTRQANSVGMFRVMGITGVPITSRSMIRPWNVWVERDVGVRRRTSPINLVLVHCVISAQDADADVAKLA